MGCILVDEVPLAALEDVPLVAYRVWWIMEIRFANPSGVEIRSRELTEGEIRRNREIVLPSIQPSHGIATPHKVIDDGPLGHPLFIQSLRGCN